ncbi:unnamed protein product [Effrenium voratum]|uniref:F5/8 type C domain-containing protein n=3 Tax=Effrenium voratum TaxID=2562239 RepID=A0AA36NL14_9DINO|nr:unnamed protein product [Effrenium voratum]
MLNGIWLFLLQHAAAMKIRQLSQGNNLASGIVPTGSSFMGTMTYSLATDGNPKTRWHAADNDIPSWLALDLGKLCTIDDMKITTAPESLNYGFKSLEIYRSDDGNAWELVRTDKVDECKAARVSNHAGWAKSTRYIKITMKDLCAGNHFSLGEWEVYGSNAPAATTASAATNLASGIVPTGSSFMGTMTYSLATDGNPKTRWHAADNDIPSWLALDLGKLCTIDDMKITTAPESLNYGFKSLEIYRSDDGNAWELVRTDKVDECKAARVSNHAGWAKSTRYIKITMKDLCAGNHFSLGEWEVYGSNAPAATTASAATNLASGIVPTGSSFMGTMTYSLATDGNPKTRWHAADNDIPSWLALDLGKLCTIDDMKITTAPESLNYGFKSLEIYRSDDGNAWELVRTDKVDECKAARVSNHAGWAKSTRYIKITMKDLCAGNHFSLGEWEVYGSNAPAATTASAATNLASGIVPTGSSFMGTMTYSLATDGNPKTRWHAADNDIPSWLALDLGKLCTIDDMKITTAPESLNYGFKSLEIYRSDDGNAWELVRTDKVDECKAARVSNHAGWAKSTRYIKITMKDLCAGNHFSLGEWEVYGTVGGSSAPGTCAGELLSHSSDDYPCDTIKDEATCLKRYVKLTTGDYHQCVAKKATDTAINCLVDKKCA